VKTQELFYRSQINQAVKFILEHLDENITIAEIAKSANFSPFHFHRIFTAYIGESLGSYVRRLRVERSLFSLIESNISITQIAFTMGFASNSAYTKAFTKHYGKAPSQVRTEMSYPQPIDKDIREERRRLIMKPRIEEVPDQRVVYAEGRGMEGNSFTIAADKAFDKLCAFLSRNHLWGQVGECLGICPDDPTSTPQEEGKYLGGFILKEKARLSETRDIKIMNLKGGKYAVFRHTGPYDNIWQTWNAIYRDWLPSSDLKLRDELPYEKYLDDKTKISPERLRTDIYIAVE